MPGNLQCLVWSRTAPAARGLKGFTLLQSAFSLKHLYEATQGQLLCGHVGTAYVFSSSDTEQNHSFSNAGLALLTDQEEDPTPFRRFPVHLYQQPDGRHIFDAGKAQHLTTKPAGKYHSLLSTSCAFDMQCTLSAPKSCMFCWCFMHSNLFVLMNVSKHLWQSSLVCMAHVWSITQAINCPFATWYAGAKEFWIIGTTSRGEPWLYPCPFSECDSCFTRPGKLSMHAATAHPQLIGKKFRVFTVQLHQPSMSVRFTAGVGGLYSIKRPLASTRSDGTVRTPAGKRQALFHRSAEQEPQVKSPPAKQQPAAHTAGQESEVLLRVKAEQALKAEQEKHAAEVKSQAAIAAATHRAEMAEAKVHYMESLQRTQDKSMESETACRQQFQAFAAEISSTLKQSVAVNALLVDSNLNLSSRKLLAQGSGLTPQIEEKRAGSEAQQVIAGRQAARFVAIPC